MISKNNMIALLTNTFNNIDGNRASSSSNHSTSCSSVGTSSGTGYGARLPCPVHGAGHGPGSRVPCVALATGCGSRVPCLGLRAGPAPLPRRLRFGCQPAASCCRVALDLRLQMMLCQKKSYDLGPLFGRLRASG